MFDLFKMYNRFNVGGNFPPNWNRIKTLNAYNLETYKNYYADSSKFVNSDHILIDILYALNIPIGLEPQTYVDAVADKTNSLSMTLSLTSAYYRGQQQKSQFFGSKCSELLIASDEEFDAVSGYKNWKNLEPVKVLSHPFTHLDFIAPFTQVRGTGHGVAVLLINVPMLALQYKAYLDDQAGNEDTYGAASFIARYVWPNMMATYQEQVWFNRLFHEMMGLTSASKSGERLPFTYVDLASKIDDAQHYVFKQISQLNNPSFEIILETVPSLSYECMFAASKLPDVAPTTQVSWALDVARLKQMVFLVKVSSEKHLNVSRNWLSQAVYSLRYDNVSAQAKAVMDKDGAQLVEHWCSILIEANQN